MNNDTCSDCICTKCRLETRGSVCIIPEGKARRDYVKTSKASGAHKTDGAVSKRLRKWCNAT